MVFVIFDGIRMPPMKARALIFFSLLLAMMPLRNLAQTTLWSDNFNNGCSASCATYTGPNGAWSFIVSPGAPAGLCGYASPNGGSSNVWYVSCAENGMANGACGAGCGANATLHMGSVTLGDLGAAYDAGRTTCKMAVSPAINTTAAGTNTKTVSFEHIRFGDANTDCAQLLYSIDNGSNWIYLANPIPPVTCCSGACGGQDQGVWVTASFTLPATTNNITTLRIGFNWKNNGSGGSDPSFAVNDLRITYNAVLPVEMVSFSAQQQNTDVEINWSTASETNSAFFEIERSTDMEVFTNAGKVNAQGNSNNMHAYSFLDKNAPTGTVYYRLKQVDLNGATHFSHIIAVNVSDKPVNPIDLTCSFGAENLVVFIKSDEKRSVTLEIYDATGKQMLSKNYSVNDGRNKVTLNADDFPGSSYIVRVSDVKDNAFSSSLVAVKSIR